MIDEERLHLVLRDVAGRLDLGGERGERRRSPVPLRRRRRLLAAAACLVAICLLVVAVAPARRAVGRWLGAGRIEVVLDRSSSTDGLAAFTDAVERIDPATAPARLGAPLPDVAATSLGAPRDWWTVPEGGVLVGWADGATSLWIVDTGGDDWVLGKLATDPLVVTDLPELGDGGVAVDGDHVVQTPFRRVRAGSAVAWVANGLTFRLEHAGDVAALIELAEQFVAANR